MTVTSIVCQLLPNTHSWKKYVIVQRNSSSSSSRSSSRSNSSSSSYILTYSLTYLPSTCTKYPPPLAYNSIGSTYTLSTFAVVLVMIAWYWLVRNNGPVDKKIVNIGNIKDQFHSGRLSINCFISLLPFSAPMKSLLKPKGSVFGIILGYLHNGDNDFRVPIEYKYIYTYIWIC